MSLPLLVSLCIVSSAFGAIVQAGAQLVPLHSTPGKGQYRAESHVGGAPGDTKVPSLLWLGWHVSPHPSQGGHLFSPLVHWLNSTKWRNGEIILTFYGKELSLSRGTQDQQIIFTEIATVSCFCRGQGRKGQTLSACLFYTPDTKGRSPSACWNFSSWFIYSEIELSNAFEWTNREIHPLIFVTVLFFPFLNNAIYSQYRYLWELI